MLLSAAKYLLIVMIFLSVVSTHLGVVLATDRSERDPLITLPGAKEAKFTNSGETKRLRYHMKASYPAIQVIDSISSRLREMGWTPLDADFLNPGLPASQLRNWSGGFAESVNHPEICVYLWQGDWRDQSGDILRYAFRYKGVRCDTTELTDLEVNATYIPSTVVLTIKETIEHMKPKTK